MVSVLLIIHMLCAVALIGAITHQSLSVWWPVAAGQQRNFVASFRGVRSAAYAKPIIILYLLTALIGVAHLSQLSHRYPADPRAGALTSRSACSS